MHGTKVPDARYYKNLALICERVSKGCGFSFSAACGPALRKSSNRLFSSEEADLLSGHALSTAQRCELSAGEYVMVVEDTTDLNYNSHTGTSGLGDLGGIGKEDGKILGLSVHSALAVGADRIPLGLLGQHIWAPKNSRRKSHVMRKVPIEEKESYKWLRVLGWIKEQKQHFGDKRLVVIGDREGDFYEHFAAERPANVELVIRLLHRRRNIRHDNKTLSINELLGTLEPAGQVCIKIPARRGQKEREAILSVHYAPVLCPSPNQRKGDDIALWLVWAVEMAPPDGVEAIDWALFTTMAVENFEFAVWITDRYEDRWIIERFHYVLKQGIRVERLQFDNFVRLSNAIRVCSIAAWSVLRTAYIAKEKSDETAAVYFELADSRVLESATGKKIESVRDHVLALGKLVGFQPSTKQPVPGEKLLWQATKLLNAMKVGWNMAQSYGTG